MDKIRYLHWAEVIDSFRVFPRLFLASSFFWAVGVTYQLLHWYMALPKEERSLEASGFSSVVFLGVTGFLKLVYDTYSRSARDWNQQPITQQTVVATTTTTPTTP